MWSRNFVSYLILDMLKAFCHVSISSKSSSNETEGCVENNEYMLRYIHTIEHDDHHQND